MGASDAPTGAVLIETPRLLLRCFREDDHAAFVQLNADPETMRYLGGTLTAEQSVAWARDLAQRPAEGRLGMMAVERRADGAFLGAAGLSRPPWFPDEVEVGWRLLPEHRGRGFATEAGRAWVDHAFDVLGVPRVLSVADVPNEASQAVMRRLGMAEDHRAVLRDGDDEFEAVVFAITRAAWKGSSGGVPPHHRRSHGGAEARPTGPAPGTPWAAPRAGPRR